MKQKSIQVLMLISAFLLTLSTAFAQVNPVTYAYSIKAEDLKKHLTFIALYSYEL